MTFIPANETNQPIQFSKFAIPLVKKLYTSLIAEKIMAVQPMTAPTGIDFYDWRHVRQLEPINWKKEGF